MSDDACIGTSIVPLCLLHLGYSSANYLSTCRIKPEIRYPRSLSIIIRKPEDNPSSRSAAIAFLNRRRLDFHSENCRGVFVLDGNLLILRVNLTSAPPFNTKTCGHPGVQWSTSIDLCFVNKTPSQYKSIPSISLIRIEYWFCNRIQVVVVYFLSLTTKTYCDAPRNSNDMYFISDRGHQSSVLQTTMTDCARLHTRRNETCSSLVVVMSRENSSNNKLSFRPSLHG